MNLLSVFAAIGMVINDLVAIISVIGSAVLFFGSFSDKPLSSYGRLVDWSYAGLIFGVFFQISMATTGTTPEKIGIVLAMTPAAINALLGLSMLLLVGRWWIKKNRLKFM